jgi:Mg2+/Co2+ transporter CorB
VVLAVVAAVLVLVSEVVPRSLLYVDPQSLTFSPSFAI